VIRIYQATTDAELDAYRRVRMAVVPNERAASVEEMRRTDTPERLMLLADRDGEVVGAGLADKADLAGCGFVAPRVVEQARRRGVGTALLRALTDHVHALGFAEANAHVDDPGSLAFAERFGFREVDRQVEQVRVVLDEEPVPPLPDGVTLVSVEEQPHLWRAAYDALAPEAFADMAVDRPVQATLEQWENEWMTWPAATFIAVADGEAIGCAGLMQDTDFPERAENSLTAVRRDWRGQGVASALKCTALAWAAAHGIREVYTWTQRGNDDMRSLNERLGYITRAVSISMRASLPLPG
jgi:mycothiol synthase